MVFERLKQCFLRFWMLLFSELCYFTVATGQLNPPMTYAEGMSQGGGLSWPRAWQCRGEAESLTACPPQR